MNHAYVLEGLSCAHCAAKIEQRIDSMKEFQGVSLNFTTQTLMFESQEAHHNYTEKLQNEINKIESGVIVSRKVKDHDSILPIDDRQAEKDNGGPNEVPWTTWIRLGLGTVLFVMGFLVKLPTAIGFSVYLIGYLVIGGDVLIRAGKNILRGQVFDENFLMSIATLGAFAIGEFPEAVTVMLFYQIGELFQNMAVNRSRKSISSLMDIRPDLAWVKRDNQLHQVSAASVQIGQVIYVKPGERVPLDGTVVEGKSMFDTSALTGESVPRQIAVDDLALSGSVNQSSLVVIKVTKSFGDSTVSRILDLVENASNKKAETEKFITKFARYYTPIVVYLALALAFIPPLLIEGALFSEWIHRALIFLVVSCPCALVISIPLGFFGGIGGASKHGILIKGSNYLEALHDVDTVVFDKTGTLTKGVFEVTKIENQEGISKESLLSMAAMVESHSNHPIAKSILKAYGKEVALDRIKEVEEVSGKGLVGDIDGEKILVGNSKLMDDYCIDFQEVIETGTILYVGRGSQYLGYLLISDEIKEDSAKTISSLKRLGVNKVVMLTGDHQSVADSVGRQLEIDQVYSELLPHDKVEILEKVMSKESKGKTIFVGDGLNDAPVLARADIGFAMGGLGSDAAIEAADVVLMTDEPSKLIDALVVAKRTRQIVWQNIVFALGVKIIVLILGAGGLATMWEAVFADVGVALIAIFNAMRIIRNPIK